MGCTPSQAAGVTNAKNHQSTILLPDKVKQRRHSAFNPGPPPMPRPQSMPSRRCAQEELTIRTATPNKFTMTYANVPRGNDHMTLRRLRDEEDVYCSPFFQNSSDERWARHFALNEAVIQQRKRGGKVSRNRVHELHNVIDEMFLKEFQLKRAQQVMRRNSDRGNAQRRIMDQEKSQLRKVLGLSFSWTRSNLCLK